MSISNSTSDVITVIRGLIQDQLRIDGRDSFIYNGDSVCTISEDFISSSTIQVFKNGTLLSPGDFSYDADNNQVTIIVSLTLNDTILIKYSYYKKYSDNELNGYLASSLAYFPMYQYKKTFEILEESIVAINDYEPTIEELYFIALIASILIDPQNIKVSIPDLNISSRRDKSDQEQIKEAFAHFKNFIGTIDFEEYINLSE